MPPTFDNCLVKRFLKHAHIYMQHVDDDSEHDGDGWGQSLLLLTSSPVALERYSSAISPCVNNSIDIRPGRLGRQDGQGRPGTTLVAQVPAPCFQATAGRQAGRFASRGNCRGHGGRGSYSSHGSRFMLGPRLQLPGSPTAGPPATPQQQAPNSDSPAAVTAAPPQQRFF